MQKKIIALALCLALSGCTMTAFAQRDATQDAFLIEKSLSVITQMHSLANDAQAMLLYTSSSDIQEVTAQMGHFDTANPSRVLIYTMEPEQLMKLMLSMDEGEDTLDIDALQTDTRTRFLRQMVSSIPSMLTGRVGANVLAAASILSTSEAFHAPEDSVYDQLLFFCYDNAEYACAVSFAQAGEGIVSANAMFIPAFESLPLDEIFTVLGTSSEMTEITGAEALSLLNK
ncbi:hypothetical protein LJC74_05865 [Eubacteriales bacterium OttesenSCG-928-A19]|nr:hypothetical protein [Eubacteriales bacterium OttesenSCG-928-A19]